MPELNFDPVNFINAKLGECYAIVDGKRYNLFHCKNITTTITKEKVEKGILGYPGRIHVTTGWKGTGSMTLYFCNDFFRKYLEEYCRGDSDDLYFKLVVTNQHITKSSIASKNPKLGTHTVSYDGVNFDSDILSILDSEGDILEQSQDFTFHGFSISSKFTNYKQFIG